MANGPFARLYWSVMDDDMFDGVRDDVRHFGSWCLMLVHAEMAYPSVAFIPAVIPKASLAKLEQCGLIEILPGGRYRVHGLSKEREKRSQSGRIASAVRWHGNRNAQTMPSTEENSIEEVNRLRTVEPARARSNGRFHTVDNDPKLREIRDAQAAYYAKKDAKK